MIRNEKWDELYDMEMNVYNLTMSSFQSYHRLKDLKLYRLTMWNFKEFGFKDLLITLPVKMFGPFWSVFCKMALVEVGVSLP